MEVLGTIEDFSSVPLGLFEKGFLDSWRWTPDFRQEAREWSRLEVVAMPEGAGRGLHVRLNDPRALTGDAKTILRLAPFYPPEADAVRIRLKVLSGQASIYIGGPTAYYGNSDFFTEPQTIRAEEDPKWVEVVFNFNHPTWRNYRRSGFSTDAPRNYYNRWAQEPVGVYLAPDSLGEFLIDRIDLVALGEGKPFAKFAPGQVDPVQTVADFEDGRRDQVFNLYMSAAEADWFEQSWTRTKPLRFEPMQLAVIDAGLNGRKALECKGRTAEEVHCTGVRTNGAAQSNAISVTLKVDAPEQSNSLVGAGPVVPVDFLIFVAPLERAFPWQSVAASEKLRASGGSGFDYQLTHRTIASRTDLDFAIYQTRRYLVPGEWSRLVLPMVDFTCVYGQGTMRGRLLDHAPLEGREVAAIAWLNPWCRLGLRDAPVVTCIDDLSFVQVPGSAEELRSFWQVPDIKLLRHREEVSPGVRRRHTWLPEE